MHACRADAIAAGIVPLPAASPPSPWHHDAEARCIYATIGELGTIAARLDEIDRRHRFLGIADAGAQLGRLIEHERRVGFSGSWVRTLGPSNGACAVSQLWDQLASIREAWITAQMRATGHVLQHHDLPADAPAWAAWDALEAATPSLAEARGMASTPLPFREGSDGLSAHLRAQDTP